MICSITFILPGSDAAVWPEAGLWTELCPPPAAGVWLGLRAQGSSPGQLLTTRR